MTLALLGAVGPAAAGPPADTIQGAAARFCFSCHGTAKQKAELNLEAVLAGPGGLAARPDVLADLLRVVRDGDMPPRTAKPQPTAVERAALVAALTAEMTAVEAASAGDPGPVVVPRLTRDEYRNVVRDLSGGAVTDGGRLLPNEGGAGEGFANVGAAQGMSPAQVEKYVEAARGVFRHLRVDPIGGLVWRSLARDPADESARARKEAVDDVIAWYVAEQEGLVTTHRDELKAKLGFAHAAYLEAAWRYKWRADLGTPAATFAEVARGYDVPLAPVALEKWYALLTADNPEPPFAEWAAAWQKLPAPAGRGPTATRAACAAIEAHKPAGKGPTPLDRALNRRNVATTLRTKVGLNAERNVFADWGRFDVKYLGGPWPDHEADKPDPLAPYHLTAEQVRRNAAPEALADLRVRLDRVAAVAQVPHQDLVAALKRLGKDDAREGVVPADAPGVAELIAKVRVAESELETTARPLVADFARRAWRRPVADGEIERLVRLYREARATGASFDAAVKAPLLAVLASPHFLYRLPDPAATAAAGATVRDLTGLELASRLSFFLWASGPDDVLLRLAADGTLRDPAVLAAQARRMLPDERAKALTTVFAAQAFRFADFDAFTGPDPKRFPEFTPALRQAMLDEVVSFLDDLFRNDRPLTDLLRADYTYVNAALAKLYGIPGVAGDAMRRVPAPPGRGGLTGMALFLTKYSPPLRTSPVQRGNWVQEDLVGRRLPDPPAGITPLSEDETNDKHESIREQLARHRANATCAACHDKIDPPGVALENFDPVGRWRTADRAGVPVTATAVAADGTTLDGADGLRAYLTERRGEVFAHFNRKLLGYALGRAVAPGDAKLLADMATTLGKHDYRLSPIVDVIVTSPQFRKARTEP